MNYILQENPPASSDIAKFNFVVYKYADKNSTFKLRVNPSKAVYACSRKNMNLPTLSLLYYFIHHSDISFYDVLCIAKSTETSWYILCCFLCTMKPEILSFHSLETWRCLNSSSNQIWIVSYSFYKFQITVLQRTSMVFLILWLDNWLIKELDPRPSKSKLGSCKRL